MSLFYDTHLLTVAYINATIKTQKHTQPNERQERKMSIKVLEKRYSKLVMRAFKKRLTEQEYEKTMDKLREIELQIIRIGLN